MYEIQNEAFKAPEYQNKFEIGISKHLGKCQKYHRLENSSILKAFLKEYVQGEHYHSSCELLVELKWFSLCDSCKKTFSGFPLFLGEPYWRDFQPTTSQTALVR